MLDDAVPPIPYEELKRVVLPVAAVGGDARWHPIGSSFVVAVLGPKRALLLTAAHNLKHVQAIDSRGSAHHPTIPPEFRPKAPAWVDLERTEVYFFLPGRTHMVFAQMVRSWSREAHDLALVLVSLRDDQDATFTSVLALDTRPVEEGCTVMAVGYPTITAESALDYDKQEFSARLEFKIECRRGSVVKVCNDGIGIHGWPGFLVTSAFDSGMSGGPVIDLSGEVATVRGVVGGDLSESVDDGALGSGIQAFASMLWPAMTTPTQISITSEDGTSLVPKNARLLDLIRHGVVDDRGRAHEHVGFEERDGVVTCWWANSL